VPALLARQDGRAFETVRFEVSSNGCVPDALTQTTAGSNPQHFVRQLVDQMFVSGILALLIAGEAWNVSSLVGLGGCSHRRAERPGARYPDARTRFIMPALVTADALAPRQTNVRRTARQGGGQRGYCTPGFLRGSSAALT
jgi:hypothetical protein